MVCPEDPELLDEELPEVEPVPESVFVPEGVVVSKVDVVSPWVDGGLEGSTGRGAVLVPPGVVLMTGASAATFMST